TMFGPETGATGWLRSLWFEGGCTLALPAQSERRLLWFFREAWPSPATRTSRAAGALSGAEGLRVTVDIDRLVAFGDGMESDALSLTWGQSLRAGISDTALRLLI